MYTVITARDADGVNEILVGKPINYNSKIVINIFGTNDVPQGYSSEANFELFSPSNELLYSETTHSFFINQDIQITTDLPPGIYTIRLSLPPTPSEIQCCFSLKYEFSFPNDIPIPISTGTGMFNFRTDQGYHSLRNIKFSTVQFGAFLNEGVEYTLEHDPWGPSNIINNVTLIDTIGNSYELSGSLNFPFVADQTGYYGFMIIIGKKKR